jgi:hypothetical protein
MKHKESKTEHERTKTKLVFALSCLDLNSQGGDQDQRETTATTPLASPPVRRHTGGRLSFESRHGLFFHSAVSQDEPPWQLVSLTDFSNNLPQGILPCQVRSETSAGPGSLLRGFIQKNTEMKRSPCLFASLTAFALCLTGLPALTGCSSGSSAPPLGDVTGKITLNGTPLPDATVEFQPAQGRPSMGVTNAQGEYRLSYTGSEKGALPGQHTVRITTARSQSGGEGGQPLIEARPELVPETYNDQTTLTADVKAGSNVIDFPLEGKRKP